MWSRALRPIRTSVHRTVLFSRRYNGQPGPHTTYFQPPPQKPPRRIFRAVFFGTTCFVAGAIGSAWALDPEELEAMGLVTEGGAMEDDLVMAMQAGARDLAAKNVPIHDLARAQAVLESGSGYSITPYAVGHHCQLPSNMPCEDVMSSGVYHLFQDPKRDWCNWSILDGHAGPKTAHMLQDNLPIVVGMELWNAKCMDRPYVPEDFTIIRAFKKAFQNLDESILRDAAQCLHSGEKDLAHSIALTAAAMSGSCALLALFDPQRSVLRVANVGDSRAVLGRWDDKEGKYVAQAMSEDQTGFNEDEVERIRREHPDEDVVDPKTGRVHGIAVSRAFGDARWKWSSDLARTVYEKFWGPTPRPNGMIKTPPYLTAEPEIMETQVQSGDHPDFLIMASDGFWDNMSSEDAVVCVQQWLDKYNPTRFIDLKGQGGEQHGDLEDKLQARSMQDYKPDFTNDPSEPDETWWDEGERAMKWRVSPKHFIVEDELHCGIHLVKNALGGKRRNLFRGLMSIQPPNSRKVRDDISVQVVFFGQDIKDGMGLY
ncbi:uncharacterized protein LTR77_000054 [Saxophila tyrrhenica]|uniref:PPM-type phosphatase domain-containing protein n=1 Tax=Saxophila tyrrhenica TaxID=1690608 RepID=A0AAV9PNN4_9PEZI|nr:hypothetical protein LTR77_000054 [Saxophila tyrrhenica]